MPHCMALSLHLDGGDRPNDSQPLPKVGELEECSPRCPYGYSMTVGKLTVKAIGLQQSSQALIIR